MRWGLVASHDLGIPLTVALPLEMDAIIRTTVHKKSDLGKILTMIRMKVVWQVPTGAGRHAFSSVEH